MDKPRIFLGSSAKQTPLLEALTRGLAAVAEVHPWTSVFNPGTSTLDRLVELTREMDFAAFLFAQDDWTGAAPHSSSDSRPGQASPRDNVVFEAGLFGGVLGMRRTFILHANGAKLPTDLLGLTCVRYDAAAPSEEVYAVSDALTQAIAREGQRGRIDGCWWQFSLTARSESEPSAISLLRIARGRDGVLELTGRSWREDGRLSARCWSEAAKEKGDPPGLFYYWNGERPLDPDAPQLHGTGEFRLESAARGTGYFTTLSDIRPELRARTSGTYLRARAEDVVTMEGDDDRQRAALIAARLADWQLLRSG